MVNKRNCAIGFILAILLIIVIGLSSNYSSSNVEVENLTKGNGYYKFNVSFRPTQDMPNARVTVKIYDTEGNYIGQNADGLLELSNFEGGTWYEGEIMIFSSKVSTTELGYVTVEVSNNQDLDILKGTI